MTSLVTRVTRPWGASPRARVILLIAVLACLVTLRAALATASADAVGVGLAFGTGLVGVSVAAGWRPSRHGAGRAAAIGLSGAAALVGLSWLARLSGPALPLAAAAPFWAWAGATALVATGEEALLRGVLFDASEAAWGLPAAIGITSLAFAVMHLPTYGAPAFPLDLGVGLVLGGLRVLSGGPGAPAVAHVAADLAAWFL
jgi:membrane protease YdiL (CAAX protease family)